MYGNKIIVSNTLVKVNLLIIMENNLTSVWYLDLKENRYDLICELFEV